MNGLKNDATKSQLGNTFQLLVALEACFSLQEGEKIHIEMFGDISKESDHDSYQAEAKHHLEEHNLSNRHGDFWNTLKNWVENKDKLIIFKKFILYTTSSYTEDSIYHEWNQLQNVEKLERIKKEGEKKKSREAAFRKLYEFIFADEDVLLDVLEKVVIDSDQVNVHQRLEYLKRDRALFTVDESDKVSFIRGLLGAIILIPTDPPHRWDISYEEFKELVTDHIERYTRGDRSLVDHYALRLPATTSGYETRCFVQEIRKIEHHKRIDEAITDVWRKNTTVIDFYSEDAIFHKDFQLYKDNIMQELNYRKDNFLEDCQGEAEIVIYKNSRKFYNDAMIIPPKPIGRIKYNQDFFQRGTIHEIVDEGKLKWYLGDGV
ncbi:hypothetical protein CIG75_03855 [Tumebacillus algifaecis]|uniref:ABC-three component systems C-terminal domain-containing protein n=1 Tax=Tumebacillus algifaecis TaxID=1214604 RepID=A0A223CY87_9BACL|nr:ABC-three component system protein [Tumebacillus algifaecis]ASS74205.1 hypothetical protein CIG75_03855 [Tumebacillus algifaecis]